MQRQLTQFDWSGQHIYVGLDVHKNSWTVTVMTDATIQRKFSQPPDVQSLVNYLQRHYPGATYHCVYEASYCGYWIHDQLQSHGVECRIVNAADVPTTDKEKRNKTNTVDSGKLARSLRNGELRGIYTPSREALEDRSMVRSRHTLVSKQTRCKNQIKSLLLFYGIHVPDDIDERYWSRRYIAWLTGLKMFNSCGDHTLQALLSELSNLRQSILSVTRAIRTLSRKEPYAMHVTNLVTLPGISILTAMIFLTELGPFSRFRSLDRLACYVGLVPGEHSTGDDRTITEITERKNPFLCWIIIECAWVAIRTDTGLALTFSLLCQRMPKHRAIIRIARKLLNRIRFVVKNQQPYVQFQMADAMST
jgi:transposase